MEVSSHSQRLIVSTSLNRQEREDVIIFLKKLKYQPHYNHPDWAEFVEPYKRPIFFRFYEDDMVSGFAIVFERMLFCVVKYGPLALDHRHIPGYIDQIVSNLKARGFGLVTFQLPFTIQEGSMLFNPLVLTSNFSFEKSAWNTVIIKLAGKTEQEVFKSFSENHKRSIKKALKEGLEIKFTRDKNHLDQFSGIYDEMYRRKGLVLSLPDSNMAFRKIIELDLGVFAGVFKQGELLGGAIFVSEGEDLLYKFGATDAKYYDIPVLHVVIYEMIKYAIETRHEFVDLGGYTPNALEGSSAHGINRFKKWFGGEIVEYFPPIEIKLNIWNYFFVKILLKAVGLIPAGIKKLLY